MKLSILGRNTSKAEVQDVSPHGVWLYVKGIEYFLPYSAYPWFEDATVADIHDVQLLHQSHLHWPRLDIDLKIESLKDRTKYPLIYK